MVPYEDVATSSNKRGRKPSMAASSKDMATATTITSSSSSSLKRRRRGGGRSSGSNKKVCNDDCEADECIQQSSDKVNWIACDDCNLWYHWICVDIRSEMEIGDRFLCPRCNQCSQRKSSRVPIFRDRETLNNVEQILRRRDHRAIPYQDVIEGDQPEEENDDLNVTLDQEDEERGRVAPSFSRVSSSGLSSPTNQTTLTASHPRHSGDSYFRESLSPMPPFLQPEECCVQEEVVEISYLSRSDSD